MLCPSMWPGAPGTSGLRASSIGVCEPSGSASISLTMAIAGWPLPQRAHRLVGMPAAPSWTVKPPDSSTSLMSLVLSNSCMPSSAK